MTPDTPWTLAERFDYAKHMAREGKSVAEIASRCGLLEVTAICILNRERPGEIQTIGRKEKV